MRILHATGLELARLALVATALVFSVKADAIVAVLVLKEARICRVAPEKATSCTRMFSVAILHLVLPLRRRGVLLGHHP